MHRCVNFQGRSNATKEKVDGEIPFEGDRDFRREARKCAREHRMKVRLHADAGGHQETGGNRCASTNAVLGRFVGDFWPSGAGLLNLPCILQFSAVLVMFSYFGPFCRLLVVLGRFGDLTHNFWWL